MLQFCRQGKLRVRPAQLVVLGCICAIGSFVDIAVSALSYLNGNLTNLGQVGTSSD